MNEEARTARLISMGRTYQNFPVLENYPYLAPNYRFIGFPLFLIFILPIPFKRLDEKNCFELVYGHYNGLGIWRSMNCPC